MISSTSSTSLQEQRNVLRQLRSELPQGARSRLQEGVSSTHVMAQLVAELEKECRKRNISQDVIQSEIMNRTVGDVNLRQVTEYENDADELTDYRLLADELGVALPGEQLHGYTATGETYLWLRDQMMEYERLLLAHNYDPRNYDIYGIGNPILRTWLSHDMQQWKLPVTDKQVLLGLGGIDCIDKVLRGLAHMYRLQGASTPAILFPEPGFNYPKWQAMSHGYRSHCFLTLPEHNFKLTAGQLDQILQTNTDIRLIYLTISNNPTTFAYTPDELHAIHSVLRRYRDLGRNILILADLAYIGTGIPEADQARMETFHAPDVLQHTIFVSSYSKTYTLTGERFGWVTCGDPNIATSIAISWTNTHASLPGEWQLRFMAYYHLFSTRPWLLEKLRRFYRLRRTRLIEQLQGLDAKLHLFQQIYIDDDTTIYNWSRLRPDEDAFSLFEKTGIAGVPGSGFGYTDAYVRFSIGVVPVLGG